MATGISLDGNTHLHQHVSASTQNQALSAILFLYRAVLDQELSQPIAALRARRSTHLPTVLTKAEVRKVLQAVTGKHQLMGQLLYGSGVRLMECVRLRVQDLDFGHQQIVVRNGKGHKDRVTCYLKSYSSL